jgi:PAS domain S-box-containing protein
VRGRIGSGLRDGLLALLALLGVGLGAEEAVRRARARATAAAAEALAAAAAAGAEEWLAERRRTTRLLVGPMQEHLSAGAAPDAGRAALAALHRTYPEVLRAALVADGDGRVAAAGEVWREGTAPDWLGATAAEPDIRWTGDESSGRFVVREPMVAPPGMKAPAWVVTAWDPGDLEQVLRRSLAPAPGAGARLERDDGGALLRVPPLGPASGAGGEAVAPVGATGLRVRAVVPGPGPRSPWPWALAAAGGLAAGAGSAVAGARRQDLDRRLRAALDLAARGEAGPEDADLARRLPQVAGALAGLRRHGSAEAAREQMLAGLRERLRGAALLLTDAAGRVEAVLGDAVRVLGRPAEEIQGHPLRRLLTASGWEALAPVLARTALQAGGAVAEVELAAERDGDRRIELTIASRDRPGGYVLLARDATEARRLRARAEEAEARYRALAEPLPDGLAVVRDGRIVEANRALAGMLGLSPAEVEGSPLRRHVAASDVLVLADHLRGLPAGGKRFDLRLVRADAIDPVEAQVSATPLEDGGAVLLFRDQGERLRAERLLLRAHRTLDATLEATSDAILVVEPGPAGDRVVFANGAFARLADLPPERLPRLPEDEAFARLRSRGVLPEGFVRWLEDLRRHRGARRSERFDSPGEPRRTFEVQGAPLDLPGGPGRVLSLRDVTAQVEVERRLRQDHEAIETRRGILEQANRALESVNRDLRARSEELDRVNRRLQQLDEMRQNLLANVSHELQTPLVSIRGYTEMILKGKIGPVTQEQERGLAISLKNIDRLIGLIDSLLEFSRAEGGLGDLRLSTFRLRDLVAETFDLMREAAARRSIRLQADYPGGDPVIRGDRDRIGQVLLNLIGNAVKFNRPGGEVVVEVSPPQRGFARVQVRDTGPGIPAEDLERIFERYARVERPGVEVEGSGLGLAIVRQILHEHGCTIRAASPPEGGAVFTFTLPLAREDDAPAPGPVRRRPSASRVPLAGAPAEEAGGGGRAT